MPVVKDDKAIAVVYFDKGDVDDGGVRSIVSLITDVLPRPLVVLTNQNYRTFKSLSSVFLFPLVCTVPFRPDGAIRGLWFRRLGSCIRGNVQAFLALRKYRLSVLLCNDFWSFWHVFLAALLLRVPIAQFVRDTPARANYFGYQWILPFCFSRFVICLSDELLASVLQSRWSKKARQLGTKFLVLPSVVTQSFLQTPSEKICDQEFTIGYVASFKPKKKQLVFIEQVIAPLSKILPSVRVVFLGTAAAGEEVYFDRCVERVKELELLQHVKFLGHVAQPQDYLRTFDVTCLTSTNEGLSRAMLESLGSAVPVISFAVCSSTEVLSKGNCGIVVEQGNYGGVVDALLKLYKNPTLRKEMGKRGQLLVGERYTAETVARIFAEELLSPGLR